MLYLWRGKRNTMKLILKFMWNNKKVETEKCWKRKVKEDGRI